MDVKRSREQGEFGTSLPKGCRLNMMYSGYQLSEIEEPHPQPPPISKLYPFLPPVAGGLRGVRGGGYDVLHSSAYRYIELI